MNATWLSLPGDGSRLLLVSFEAGLLLRSLRLLLCSIWSGCNFIPEDLHPKSFRGSFGHNTNVWAIRERASGMPIGPPVGVFSLDQDLHEWFTRTEHGMAGRPCKHLQPNVQVSAILQ